MKKINLRPSTAREFERHLRAAGFSHAEAKAITAAGWVAAMGHDQFTPGETPAFLIGSDNHEQA